MRRSAQGINSAEKPNKKRSLGQTRTYRILSTHKVAVGFRTQLSQAVGFGTQLSKAVGFGTQLSQVVVWRGPNSAVQIKREREKYREK